MVNLHEGADYALGSMAVSAAVTCDGNHTLTQSAVVIALCLVMVWLYRRRAQG